MSTDFGSAGIPGTRLNVCGGWVDNIIIYPVLYNTSPRLGAGALMLNDWTGLLQFIIHTQFIQHFLDLCTSEVTQYLNFNKN